MTAYKTNVKSLSSHKMNKKRKSTIIHINYNIKCSFNMHHKKKKKNIPRAPEAMSGAYFPTIDSHLALI
jgi:hypothetical protein